MEILTLEILGSGYARVSDIRPALDKSGNVTQRSYVSLSYEGGHSEVLVNNDLLKGISVQSIVSVYLALEPLETGYMYQGRLISRPGFRIMGVRQILPYTSVPSSSSINSSDSKITASSQVTKK